jgi:uncharacterized metal-binding protein
MNQSVACAQCRNVACTTEDADQRPANCPIKTKRAVIEAALAEYAKPAIKAFARQAAIQEFECYMPLPEGMTPRNPRVEEIAQFAKKMGFKKLGIAFCGGLSQEAEVLDTILENRGFNVVSVRCSVGGIPKETIGVSEKQKISGLGTWETMCNPITQAMILNEEKTELNIVVGLCVGHDALFFQYAEAPCTVLIAKDRVFGHNPAAGLYLSQSYYKKLLRKENS